MHGLDLAQAFALSQVCQANLEQDGSQEFAVARDGAQPSASNRALGVAGSSRAQLCIVGACDGPWPPGLDLCLVKIELTAGPSVNGVSKAPGLSSLQVPSPAVPATLWEGGQLWSLQWLRQWVLLAQCRW